MALKVLPAARSAVMRAATSGMTSRTLGLPMRSPRSRRTAAESRVRLAMVARSHSAPRHCPSMERTDSPTALAPTLREDMAKGGGQPTTRRRRGNSGSGVACRLAGPRTYPAALCTDATLQVVPPRTVGIPSLIEADCWSTRGAMT